MLHRRCEQIVKVLKIGMRTIDRIKQKCFEGGLGERTFVFCCFTGLAFVDVKQLRKDDLTVGSGGEMSIRKQRQKSGVFYYIPSLPIPKQILDKYKDIPLPNGQILPVPTNQKMNAYLKEIADVCGINKTLTTHCARHTKIVPVKRDDTLMSKEEFYAKLDRSMQQIKEGKLHTLDMNKIDEFLGL